MLPATKMPRETARKTAGKGRFGTFSGVFTPNVLTILGIILFVRIGWVVGHTGLVGASAIIVMANLISFLTGLSLSSIATNMHVKTGGTYYMIARTLGLEIGGAIGIPLYLSQAISVAFYIIGFTETFAAVFPQYEPRMVSTLLALAFGFVAYVGADFTLKIQTLILAVLALALTSFFCGGWGQGVSPELFPGEESGVSFWHAFAIFFPAVTGITVGASMSGDLKDPARSIPRGTLSAIGITFLIYWLAAFWLATHATPTELMADNMIFQKIARWPVLILLGVWASTLSSALGSILAAPRTLQALSFDRVVPRAMGAQMGSATEPRLAVLVTTAIAVGIIWLGNLNFVAPIITMFFLNTYGMINLAAGVETLVGNPSFRPQFKVPWAVYMLGAVGCYGAMFLINTPATLVAILISYGIFILLGRRSIQHDWGDVRSGVWFTVARYGLLRLEAVPWSVKNWRPNIVVLTGSPQAREQLMEVGTWLSSGRGIVTFYHILVGDVDELAGRGLRETSRKHIRKYLLEHGVTAFAECSIASDFYGGAVTTLQAHGIAGLEPNTVLLGWSSLREAQKEQVQLVRRLVSLKKSVLLLHYDEGHGFGRRNLIDVWWRGRDRNAELMLILAHIISRSPAWEGTKIRVLRLLESEEGRPGAEEHIARFLNKVRVEAQPVILVRSAPDQPFTSVLRQTSSESDLVLLGMRLPEPEALESYEVEMQRTLQSTRSALLVRSAELEDILGTEE